MSATEDTTAPPAEPPLGYYLKLLARNWWLVALVVAVALGASVAYTSRQDDVYRAKMALVVGQGKGLLDPSALGQSPEPFTQTISGLLTSDVVAGQVIQKLGLTFTPTHVLDRLKVESEPQSTVLDVSYDSTDREEALGVLRGFAEVFDEVLGTNFPAGGQTGAGRITVTVFDPPRLLADRVSPHPVRNLAVAGVLGLLMGMALALARGSVTRQT